jgi:DNA polymerase III subunit delta'
MVPGLERHPNALAILGPALEPGGAPSHAYLFYGPGGAGKRELARAVAATLLAHGAPDPASAHARALAGVHPDLTWVSPSGAHEILVSDIDQPVIAAASKTPFESARSVFVIESVDQLGDEAANRMLKTLEEPASFVHLILITDRLGDVLPTIRSRCQVVRFDAPSEEEIAGALAAAGIVPDTAVAYARLGLGDAGRARELAEPEGTILRDRAQALVRLALAGQAAVKAPWVALLEAVTARGELVKIELEERMTAELELYPRKERKRVETEWNERTKRARRRVETGALDMALIVVEAWLLDLAAMSWGADETVRNVDRISELQADANAGRGADVQALREAVELVEDTRTRFLLNVSEDLAGEALTYRLETVLAG